MTNKIQKRDYMRRSRLDPAKHERILESQRRCYANGAAQRQKDRIKRMQKDDPFRWRALLLTPKFGRKVTKEELEKLWTGRCGISGYALDIRDADVDHIHPVSRGGSHETANLRWVWNRANEAKGNMTDAEFLAFCKQVVEWIGRQIVQAGKNQ